MQCAVWNCVNQRRDPSEKKSFFNFPKDPKLREKWLQFCRRSIKYNPKTWRICNDHFKEVDIEGHYAFEMGLQKKRYLRPDAVPCIYTSVSPEDEEELKRLKEEKRKEIIRNILSDLPTSSRLRPNIEVDEDSATNACEERIQISNALSTPIDIKILPTTDNTAPSAQLNLFQKEINELKQENFVLQEKLSYLEQKYNDEKKVLQKKLTKAEFAKTNMEERLMEIFTEGQIKKIKSGNKRQVWSETDIANSITLYSVSAKAYRLLKEKQFPLPAIRTLQHWAQKNNISLNGDDLLINDDFIKNTSREHKK